MIETIYPKQCATFPDDPKAGAEYWGELAVIEIIFATSISANSGILLHSNAKTARARAAIAAHFGRLVLESC